MKHAFLLLLLVGALATAGHAQDGDGGPFTEQHVQAKRLERIAMGLRAQQNLRIARGRQEIRYAENRRRCQQALRVAELCGKFAGTFYCDEKGFEPVAPGFARPAVLDSRSRYKMDRCALDAGRTR